MTKTSRLLLALVVGLAASASGALGRAQEFPVASPHDGYGPPGYCGPACGGPGYGGPGYGGPVYGGAGYGGPDYSYYASGGEGPFGGFSRLKVPLPGTLSVSLNGASEGLGYDGSYVSTHGTIPLGRGPMHGWWLLDARTSLSEEGQPFANIGVVRRTHFSHMCADLGLGVFYDYDADEYDEFGHDFHQVGVSAHMWTHYLDLNINGYIPVGNTEYFVTAPFFENLLVIRPGFDIAMEGWDFDVALRPNCFAQHSGTFHFGGYSYSGETIDPFGGFAFQFEFQPKAGLTLGAGLTSDDEFDTSGLFTIAWNWGSSRGYSPTGRDLDPIRRNAHIVPRTKTPIFAINPATGTFYRVVHVDNSNDNNGDGTFEDPYNELADADGTIGGDSGENDIIFVHTGLSTNLLGNPANLAGYDQGIGLLNGQRLLGDGVEHTVPTQFGPFTFSQFEDGLLPTITNNGGNAVTLANFNTVSGLSIQGFGSDQVGIIDNGAGAIDTLIDSVIVQGYSAPGGFGVFIDPSINTIITNSTITGNDTNIFLGPSSDEWSVVSGQWSVVSADF